MYNTYCHERISMHMQYLIHTHMHTYTYTFQCNAKMFLKLLLLLLIIKVGVKIVVVNAILLILLLYVHYAEYHIFDPEFKEQICLSIPHGGLGADCSSPFVAGSSVQAISSQHPQPQLKEHFL